MKTKSLVLGSAAKILKIESGHDVQPYLSIGEQKIEMITNVRYLRVQLDSQIN